MNRDINNSVIDSLVDGLNPPQKKAVTMPFDRHCLILAGAGCGKTAVLTRRIAFCAHILCEQNRILALTFTRRAAEEMKSRLVKLPGITKNTALPVVTTFHGYGLQILRETVKGIRNAERLGYKAEPQLITEDERLSIIADISTIDQRKALGGNILALDDLLARRTINPHKINQLPQVSQKILEKIADTFSQVKIERNFWEFSDMIIKVLALFSQYPDIAEHYSRDFSYILVDEFQDTNPLQITMLNNLLSSENNLFAVGDDDQAIYGFRGADIGPIMHFQDHFPGADIVKLETNYRSTPSILNAANRIFSDKPPQYRKVLKSGKFGEGEDEKVQTPEKYSFVNHAEMAEWIIKTAKRIEKEEGIPLPDMAVLFRINETLDHTKREVEKRLDDDNTIPNFLTVHGSKGLEFPVVFLCDLEESIFPSYRLRRSHRIRTWSDVFKRIVTKRKADEIECDFDEEKRLFYVGVTRAERFLFLLNVKEKSVHGRRVLFRPSRFLKLL
jgi:superfamily I DNA/RNA helicase